jgi:hypothetical protein
MFVLAQIRRKDAAHVRFIIDNQNSCHAPSSG